MHELMHPRIRPRVAEQGALDRKTIQQLRDRLDHLAANDRSKPSVADVTTVVQDLIAIVPLAETAAKMPRADIDEGTSMVLDIVATFGTWLTHSEGTSGAKIAYASDDDQMALFQTSSVERSPSKARGPITVRIPVGYEPTATKGRDVSKALAAIVASRPDSDVIGRFTSRTYRTRSATLTYPIVAGVWKFAASGRLDRIDQVSDDPVFHAQVVSAYDLLDVARCEAIERVEQLRVNDSPMTKDEVLATCERIAWLSERDFGKLAETARNTHDDDVVARGVRLFNGAVAGEPDRFHPVSIASLTAGQVQRICAGAGLKVVEDTRSQEMEVRAKLRDFGFSRDADRLVPEALRAIGRGQAPEFWAIMAARHDGDPTWSEQLEELTTA